jgi:hypothetical protein
MGDIYGLSSRVEGVFTLNLVSPCSLISLLLVILRHHL